MKLLLSRAGHDEARSTAIPSDSAPASAGLFDSEMDTDVLPEETFDFSGDLKQTSGESPDEERECL